MSLCEFLEQLFNHNFTLQLSLPTRITENTVALIGNIFVNGQAQKYNFGNITMSISDRLHQLITIENGKGDKPADKTAKTTYRNYKNYKALQGIDWTFATHNNKVNLGFEAFLQLLNTTLDKHARKKEFTHTKKIN